MEEDKKLIWKFPEFDMEFPVRVGKVDPDSYISFYCDSFLVCLKAYLEYGINLRKGAFDFISDK